MKSYMALFLGLLKASGLSLNNGRAVLAVKSEMSGLAIPLFTDPADTRDPVWLSLNLGPSILVGHSEAACPSGLSGSRDHISAQNLFLADGTIVGRPSVAERPLSTGSKYTDVCGVIGIGPQSDLLGRGALYIHGVDANNLLLKLVERLGERKTAHNRWESRGKLVRRKSGRSFELMPEGSRVEINLLSDDVILPSRTMAHFTGRKTKLGVSIRDDRLYLPCKRFDSVTNTVYDLSLQVNEQEVRVPVKKSISHSRITDQGILFWESDLCASNLVFGTSERASVGRSVLDYHDVILGGNKGDVDFIPFDSLQRLFLEQGPRYHPPRLLRFHLDVNSLHVFDSQPVRHAFAWSTSKSAEWRKDDFIVTKIVRTDQGIVEKIELRCLFECPRIIPGSLADKWYGSCKLEADRNGDLVLSENMDDSHYKIRTAKNDNVVSIKFEYKGKRFVVNEKRSIPRRVVYLSAVKGGAIQEREEFVVGWPIKEASFGPMEISPAIRERFRKRLMVLYGKPEFAPTSDLDIQIRASSTAEGYVYPVKFTSDAIQVGFSMARWHQVRLEGNQMMSFNFAPLRTGEEFSNEFALPWRGSAKLEGEIGRYSFSVSAVPDYPFRESPFELPTKNQKWRGEPVLTENSQNGWISIVPTGSGLEYDVLSRNSGKNAELFFIATQAQRFMVPRHAEIHSGQPLVFAPVTGLPVEGEFILSIGRLPPALETLPRGVLRLTFHNVLCHSIEVAYMAYDVLLFGGGLSGRWVGKPELVLNGKGELQLHAIPGDNTVYTFRVKEDWKTKKVTLDFMPY